MIVLAAEATAPDRPTYAHFKIRLNETIASPTQSFRGFQDAGRRRPDRGVFYRGVS